MTIVVAIIVFSIIVIVHEFGHFIVAVKNGILVEEFAIGMGPKLFSTKRNNIVYSLRVLPIGGFCKMHGEDINSYEEGSFNTKSVGVRMAVLVAGATMNFILALFLIVILTAINGYYEPVIKDIIPNMPAQEAGLQADDKIISINNKKIRIYQDLQLIMAENTGDPVLLKIKRGKETFDINITPRISENNAGYLIGFAPASRGGLFAKESPSSIIGLANASFWTMVFYIKATISGFFQILTFNVAPEEVSGPIGIVNLIGGAYKSGLKESILAAIQNVASLAALLSANLGAVNLLPLPALDGGRLVFLLIEAIRKRPINPEKEGMVHFAGFVLLMLFMAFIAYNDIIKFF